MQFDRSFYHDAQQDAAPKFDSPETELSGKMLRFAEQVDDMVALTNQALPCPSPQVVSHPFAGQVFRVMLPGDDPSAYGALTEQLSRDSIWRLPESVRPSTILDIGSGAGLRAMYFAHQYPQAAIRCIEPRTNHAVCLEMNLSRYVPDAELADSFAPAGFPLRYGSLKAWLDERSLQRADIICLDAAGFELELIRELPRGMRFGAQAIVGRLHGMGDWQLLDLLAASHEIAIHKKLGQRSYPFIAVRRDLAGVRHDGSAA